MKLVLSRSLHFIIPSTIHMLAWTLCASSLLLQGCTHQSARKVKLTIPEAWVNTEAQQAKTADSIEGATHIVSDDKWWKQLSDPILNELVEKALLHNADLTIALESIRQARAQTDTAWSALFPAIGGMASASRGNTSSSASSNSAAGTSSSSSSGGAGKLLSTYRKGFDASYEVDLFGAYTNLYKAAKDNKNQFDAQYAFIKNALIAEVTAEYVNHLLISQKTQLLSKRIEVQNESLNLVQTLYKSGVNNVSAVEVAKADYETLKAQLPTLVSALNASHARMSILIGEELGVVNKLLSPKMPIQATRYALPELKAPLFLDKPASIIRLRPDVKAAEYTFKMKTHLLASSIGSMYPTISLSAFFGTQRTSAVPTTTIWSLGSNVAASLLDFGKLRSQVNAADAVKMQAMAQYEKVVLQAVAEIETNLSNLSNQAKQSQSLELTFKNTYTVYNLAKIRYKNGLTSNSEVLAAKQQMLINHNSWTSAKAQELLYSIALQKSLYHGDTY